jgi:rhodanese-related sulfurtransferase
MPRVPRILALFATRAEIGALAPALRALAQREGVETGGIAVAQPDAPLAAFAAAEGVRIDRELRASPPGAAPQAPFAQLLPVLDPLLAELRTACLLVAQGSAAAAAGALAAFLRGIPVAVREAEPRGGEAPPPETASERLIARLAALCWAPTQDGAPVADAILRLLAEDTRGAARPVAAPRSLADFVDAAKRVIREISPEEARRLLDTPGHQGWHFVDVREPDEYAAGHLPTAKSSPRGFLEVKADLVHPKRDPWLADRTRKLVLYCGGGHRSALAAQALREMGFRQVVSLAGGFAAWTQRDYPVER